MIYEDADDEQDGPGRLEQQPTDLQAPGSLVIRSGTSGASHVFTSFDWGLRQTVCTDTAPIHYTERAAKPARGSVIVTAR